MIDLAVVTCQTLPEPDPDADRLANALGDHNISFSLCAWDDPTVNWSAARLTLLRSTWNYPQHSAEFLAWIDRVAPLTALWNPAPIVRWNLHKSYLIELAERGIPVTPTVLIPRGSMTSVADVMRERDWHTVVLKPAISAGSILTCKVGLESLEAGERHLAQLLAERDALVQPYLDSVDDYGERALVWIDGQLTHAVRKTPRFAADAESVSTTAVPITSAEATLAKQVLDAVAADLLYARIDMVPGPTGQPTLMELELVEPSLFFRQGPVALERLIAGLQRRLKCMSEME